MEVNENWSVFTITATEKKTRQLNGSTYVCHKDRMIFTFISYFKVIATYILSGFGESWNQLGSDIYYIYCEYVHFDKANKSKTLRASCYIKLSFVLLRLFRLLCKSCYLSTKSDAIMSWCRICRRQKCQNDGSSLYILFSLRGLQSIGSWTKNTCRNILVVKTTNFVWFLSLHKSQLDK